MLCTSLKKDMCNLRMPGTARKDIDEETISNSLPAEIQYACLYFDYHIQKSGRPLKDWKILSDFLNSHFLHWIEALGLMGRITDGIKIIGGLQEAALVSHPNAA